MTIHICDHCKKPLVIKSNPGEEEDRLMLDIGFDIGYIDLCYNCYLELIKLIEDFIETRKEI